jgi:chromosome segregation ATPase
MASTDEPINLCVDHWMNVDQHDDDDCVVCKLRSELEAARKRENNIAILLGNCGRKCSELQAKLEAAQASLGALRSDYGDVCERLEVEETHRDVADADLARITADLEAAQAEIAEMNMMYEHPMNMLNGKNIKIAQLRAALVDVRQLAVQARHNYTYVNENMIITIVDAALAGGEVSDD